MTDRYPLVQRYHSLHLCEVSVETPLRFRPHHPAPLSGPSRCRVERSHLRHCPAPQAICGFARRAASSSSNRVQGCL